MSSLSQESALARNCWFHMQVCHRSPGGLSDQFAGDLPTEPRYLPSDFAIKIKPVHVQFRLQAWAWRPDFPMHQPLP